MPNVLVPIANGSEEMEAVIIIDTLRRAGIAATVTAIGDNRTITASRNVALVADALWDDMRPNDFDAIVLPGGAGGTEAMIATTSLRDTIQQFDRQQKLIGAICAAPLVLQAAGVIKGQTVTCHPGVADKLTQAIRLDKRVVQNGHLITSQGPGTAFEFAFALIATLCGPETVQNIMPGLILPA